MALETEEASADAMKPLWFKKYSAEGHTVVSHPEYGDVPAWNNEIAMAIVGLLNYGPQADIGTVYKAAGSLKAKENQ